ncbi:Importin-13 [Hondaea fermentalgiana]|uniref:Importin-13 n=1 Tax=Hondaea fermentalgiana TaxID=2315210 RepID=A0A2R5G6X6_9STRA|nr:Importin-13 [Hondaea fermentalgiana]|eukprot:GBG25548.1 Importin-13 [Hondaea fermentalgiana]
MATAEEVQNVIHVVYQNGAAENARREALAWLQNFSAKPESWATWLDLVASQAQQTQFFAANMIYTKVQKDWYDQPDAVKQDVHGRVLQLVREFVRDDSQRLSNRCLRRLCLALARMTVQTPSVLDMYMNEAWTLLSAGLDQQQQAGNSSAAGAERALFVATELLIVLPEEKEAEDPPSTASLSDTDPQGIAQRMRGVLAQVVEAVTQLMMKSDKSHIHARALEVLHAWASTGVDVPTLAQCNLLRPMLMSLVSCQELNVLEMASQALVACVKKDSPEAITGQEESPATLASFDELVEGILAARGRIAATCEANPSSSGQSHLSIEQDPATQEEVALSLCKLVVAVAEAQIDRVVVGATPSLLALVDIVMMFTAHHSRNVAILTLEFWHLVQDYSLSQRHESLREPCYLQLLEVLLRQSQIPEDASSGYEEDIPDDVQSFRNSGDGVKELFIVIMYVLGPRYVECMLSVLRGTQDWKAFEAALFALSSASRVINEQASKQDPRSATLRSFVETMLQELASLGLFGANGATLGAGVQVIGSFASFLARMDLGTIERNLECVIFALPFSDPVSRTGAEAFQRVCIASRLELALHADAVKTLATGIENAYQKFPTDPASHGEGSFAATKSVIFPLQARMKAIEGITRIASCMKLDAGRETLAVLLNPGLQRLFKAVNASDANVVAQELSVLCCAANYVDINVKSLKSPLDHPVSAILSEILPLLENITANAALQRDTEVVDALYSLISASFLSAKAVLLQHLDTLLTSAVTQFRITWSPSCVSCLGKAVEVFSSQPGAEAGFKNLFARLTESMVVCIQEGHVTSDPTVVSTFFNTSLTFLIFCPGAIFAASTGTATGASANGTMSHEGDSTLDTFLQILARCVSSDEVETLRSVAVFLTSLMSRLGGSAAAAAAAVGNANAAAKARSVAQYRPIFDNALGRNGRDLVKEIILALAATCPPTPLSRLAQGMADLAVRYPQLVQSAVYDVFVQNPSALSRLTDADKEALVTTIPFMAQGVGTRAKDAFLEFARLCRKQTSSDCFRQLMSSLRAPPEVIEIA